MTESEMIMRCPDMVKVVRAVGSMSNWMNELADKTFSEAMKARIKSMRNELRKHKIKRIFGWE